MTAELQYKMKAFGLTDRDLKEDWVYCEGERILQKIAVKNGNAYLITGVNISKINTIEFLKIKVIAIEPLQKN